MRINSDPDEPTACSITINPCPYSGVISFTLLFPHRIRGTLSVSLSVYLKRLFMHLKSFYLSTCFLNRFTFDHIYHILWFGVAMFRIFLLGFHCTDLSFSKQVHLLHAKFGFWNQSSTYRLFHWLSIITVCPPSADALEAWILNSVTHNTSLEWD